MLILPDDLRVALQLEQAEEMRQCLCLHVALAFEGDWTTAWGHARDLRRELWEESSAAFQHLGDASPYISTAEAFVRHNAHDCIYPDHEKDFRVLQLLPDDSCKAGFWVSSASRIKGSSRSTLSEERGQLKGTGQL